MFSIYIFFAILQQDIFSLFLARDPSFLFFQWYLDTINYYVKLGWKPKDMLQKHLNSMKQKPTSKSCRMSPRVPCFV